MLDKTIFEAAACGCLVLARSEDYHAWVDERLRLMSDSAEELAQKLRVLLALPDSDAHTMREGMRRMVLERHSLAALAKRLHKAMV
jgi:glycosyltransferase involved in cell wall biosynthesis